MSAGISSRWNRAVRRWIHRARVVEAALLLTAAGAAQRWFPMPQWSRLLGQVGPPPVTWRGERIEELPLRWATISERNAVSAITTACRLLPWSPTCLAEASAGQLMLRLARSPGVVVIGLRPDDRGPIDAWEAHAWLMGRHGALTGGKAARGFTATTVFQVPGGITADEVELTPPRLV